MTDSMHAADDIPEPDAAIVKRPDLQPDTQGDTPLDAELGGDGEGDLAVDDAHQHSGDAPEDLRADAPSGPVHESEESS